MTDQFTRRRAACLMATITMLSCIPAAFAVDLTNLRYEYRVNPLGIDAEKPRLSWVIEEASQKTEVRNRRPIKSLSRVRWTC